MGSIDLLDDGLLCTQYRRMLARIGIKYLDRLKDFMTCMVIARIRFIRRRHTKESAHNAATRSCAAAQAAVDRKTGHQEPMPLQKQVSDGKEMPSPLS